MCVRVCTVAIDRSENSNRREEAAPERVLGDARLAPTTITKTRAAL